MKYYDIAFAGFDISGDFTKRLGFERIFRLGTDVPYIDVDSKAASRKGDGPFMAYGRDKARLLKEARNGAVLSISDFFIDRRLMAIIKDLGTKLVIPISDILEADYIERSKRIYRASRFIGFAMKIGMEVHLASMARSPLYLNSHVQLIEIAKMLGVGEDYARKGMGALKDVFEQ